MDFETTPIQDVEAYLRSFGGFYATIPGSLTISVRQLRDNEKGRGEISEAIKRSREDAYERALRQFAEKCAEYETSKQAREPSAKS